MNVSSVAVSPDSDIVYIGSAYNFGIQKLQVSDRAVSNSLVKE